MASGVTSDQQLPLVCVEGADRTLLHVSAQIFLVCLFYEFLIVVTRFVESFEDVLLSSPFAGGNQRRRRLRFLRTVSDIGLELAVIDLRLPFSDWRGHDFL